MPSTRWPLFDLERGFAGDLNGAMHHPIVGVTIVNCYRARTNRVPLEVRCDRGGFTTSARHHVVGMIERNGIRLVANRPLREWRFAQDLGPQLLTLGEAVAVQGSHLPIGHVQQPMTTACQAPPVPNPPTPAVELVTGDQSNRT